TCKLFQSIGGYSADLSTDSGIKHQSLAVAVESPTRVEEEAYQRRQREQSEKDRYEAARGEPPANAERRSGRVARVKAGGSLGYLNLRSGPGQSYGVVTRIPAGADGVVLGGRCVNARDGKSAYPFCTVTWRGHVGWVSSNGLE